ncbi:MAG TPA: hypothetical protein VFU02_17445, partial [Polyangiaceae bacterium]|nr:hypothetical protein [Polyangiaceae bacterium]
CKPTLEPELLREDALSGNFFEELARIVDPWLGAPGVWWPAALLGVVLVLAAWAFSRRNRSLPMERVPSSLGGPYRSGIAAPSDRS